jgi:D-lactate dehydrogenase (cytochrome)
MQLQRRWKSDNEKDERNQNAPFNLQLFESITKRVQREKAQQIEMAALQQRTARGQFFATITGVRPTEVRYSQ